jgi:hypothetical protein
MQRTITKRVTIFVQIDAKLDIHYEHHQSAEVHAIRGEDKSQHSNTPTLHYPCFEQEHEHEVPYEVLA